MYLILYDISSEKVRVKIVKYLKNKGLFRLQKSIFAGNIKKVYIEEVIVESNQLISLETDSFIILKIDKDSFKTLRYYGQKININKYLKNMNPIKKK
ncbi:MAG: CRISPR-associated endonuclease Cas2 [Peptostreptococcaceae bacterium]